MADHRFVIEMAPVRDTDGMQRGVVAEGPVGALWAARLRIFRYEIRCWRGGVIPDMTKRSRARGAYLTMPTSCNVCSPSYLRFRRASGVATSSRWGDVELELGGVVAAGAHRDRHGRSLRALWERSQG